MPKSLKDFGVSRGEMGVFVPRRGRFDVAEPVDVKKTFDHSRLYSLVYIYECHV